MVLMKILNILSQSLNKQCCAHMRLCLKKKREKKRMLRTHASTPTSVHSHTCTRTHTPLCVCLIYQPYIGTGICPSMDPLARRHNVPYMCLLYMCLPYMSALYTYGHLPFHGPTRKETQRALYVSALYMSALYVGLI